MYPLLVADIGGTNARFALVTGKNSDGFILDQVRVLATHSYSTFEDALSTYLEGVDQRPTAASIAIAGPVDGDRVKMTNLSWAFTGTELSRRFGFNKTLLLNDFAAVASACGNLEAAHLAEIKPGIAKPGGTRVVFGPGTGLGVAGLIQANGKWLPIASEGGHANIAPATPYEADIAKAAMSLLGGHVSAEMLISGPGLVNLYKIICHLDGLTPKDLKPRDISRKAIEDADPQCQKSLDTLVSLLGSFAGSLALTYGAKGGVFIAGGIVPKILDFVKNGKFVERFGDKGVMSHYLTDIPVSLITHSETAFVGAAAWLEQHL